MVHDEKKLEMATQFRKRGFTYSEIAKICGVSKSTVSNWLATKAFSKKVKTDNIAKAARENVRRIGLVNKARNAERKARYAEAVRSAETEFKHYKSKPLFIAGLMLYLASGDQTDSSRIRLSTKRHEEHRIFIKFLTTFLGVEKSAVVCWIQSGGTESAASVVTTWSRKIGLPVSCFGKTQFVKKNVQQTLHNDVGNTIIANTVLKRKLTRWLELAIKEL